MQMGVEVLKGRKYSRLMERACRCRGRCMFTEKHPEGAHVSRNVYERREIKAKCIKRSQFGIKSQRN